MASRFFFNAIAVIQNTLPCLVRLAIIFFFFFYLLNYTHRRTGNDLPYKLKDYDNRYIFVNNNNVIQSVGWFKI